MIISRGRSFLPLALGLPDAVVPEALPPLVLWMVVGWEVYLDEL